jgi:glycosyltransferase involved in cell wall biosynthesis
LVHGIALEDYGPQWRDPSLSSGKQDGDEILFGAIGNFHAQKNYPALLDAFAITVRELPTAKLAVAGIGTEGPQMAQLIAERSLESSVQALGTCDDVSAFLRSIDVFVHAASFEAGPLVVMEALAAGVPVVSSRVGIVASHLKHGQEALISEPDNPEARARNMIAAGSSSELRLVLAQQGYARRDLFSAASATQQVERMILHALDTQEADRKG